MISKLHNYFGLWSKVLPLLELKKVLTILDREYKLKNICPKKDYVFKAFKLCPLEDLKVVFLGLDPYPQKDIATGILFGNNKDTPESMLSSSLKVIRDAALDLSIPKYGYSFDATLESWAKQGILMLNSALTVEMNKIGSHSSIWRPFISSLLINLSKSETGIIYVLFGEQTATFAPYINQNFNTVIKVKHPSYYARIGKDMPSDIFKRVSDLCREKYGTSIKWFTYN